MSNLPPYNITFTPSSGNTLSSSDISTTISNYGGFKQARYFFIQLETTNTPMNYAEIEIYDETDTNIGLNLGTSSYAQSSPYTSGGGIQHIASYAFNGITSGTNEYQHTYFYSGNHEWLGVDLGSNKNIAGIRVYGRGDSNNAVGGTMYARTAPFRIFLYTASEYSTTKWSNNDGPIDYYSYHLHTNDATKNEKINNNQQVFYYGIIATGANTTNYSATTNVKSIVFASPKYIFNNTSGSISSSNVNTTLSGYTGLFTAILGPDVDYIQANGFQGKNVTDISFANATLLQAETFKGCTQLVSVTIPNTIGRVQWNVFENCSRLSKAKIHKYGSDGTEVEYAIGYNEGEGQQVFQGCTYLAVTIVSYDKLDNIGIGGTTDIITYDSYDSNNITIHYEIPDGTTTIPTGAFKWDNHYNKTISIPNGVTTIGNEAFYHTGIIGQVVLPNSVTTMEGSNNFEYNPLMTSFIFPTNASFTSIPGWSFKNNTGLTSITIPNSVTSIGRHAFYGCTSLDQVTLHKYPGDNTSNIPISLGGDTGSDLSGNVYTTDVFDGMKPDATFTIFSNEIMDINTDIIPVRYVFYERDLTTVQAEGSMVEFEVWDENNTRISHTLNPTVLFSSKWEGSTSNNYQQSNINDGNTADAVGEWYSKAEKQSVYDVFGTESGTYKKPFIGYDFGSAKKISKIVLTACNKTTPYNHENVLAGSSTNRQNNQNGYKLYFTNHVRTVSHNDTINENPHVPSNYYTCVDPNQPYVVLSSYDYTTFENATNDYYTTLISQFNYRYQIIDGITSIAANAFKDRTDLLSVDIPNSVTDISNSAFEGTSNMTSCTLPINAFFTTISERCFYNSGLTSIAIPDSVTSIGESAFEVVTSLSTYQYVFIEGVAKRLELAEIEIFDNNDTLISQNGNWTMVTSGGDQGEMTTSSGDAFYFNGSYDQTQKTEWNPINIFDNSIPSSHTANDQGKNDQGSIEHELYPRAYQRNLFDNVDNIPYCVLKFNQPKQIGKIVIHCRRDVAYNNGAGSVNSSNHNIYLANEPDIIMATRPSNWGDTTRTTPTIPWISGINYKSILHTNSGVSWAGINTSYQYSKTYDFSDVNLIINTIGNGENIGLASCTFTANSSLETIGTTCFKNSGLTSISIPNSVTDISNSAFEGTSSMTSCTLPPNNASFTTIPDSCFYNSGLTSISIPNSVTSIGTFAFEGTSSMTSCTLPPNNASFTTISESCFKNSGLTSIAIPDSVTLIVVSAFQGTSSMTSCILPINASFTTIPNWTFYYSGLTSIAIPDSVTSIGTSVFEGNSSMTSCTFTANSSLETIGTTCFKNSGLTSITIPNSVTSIGRHAFYGCTSLDQVTLHKYPGDNTSNNPISLGGVTGSDLSGNVYTTDVFDSMKPNATFTIFSNEIMDINTDIIPVRYVFYERDTTGINNNAAMVKFEVWDENNTKISDTLNPTVLFSSKWGGSNQYEPNYIKNQDVTHESGEWHSRSHNNGEWQSVDDVFGNTDKSYVRPFIGYDFGSAKKISKIVLTACGVSHVNTLAGTSNDRDNKVNGYNLYFTNHVRTVNHNISTSYAPSNYYTCVDPNQPYVVLSSYDYTTFENATNDYYTTLISQFNYRYQIIDGITSIAANAFKDRTDLLSVDISNSVTEIGTSAFEGTSSMTSCTLPINAFFTTISESCFKNSGLTSIAIPDSVTSIGTSVFEGTSSMTSCTFTANSSLETIGTTCFKNSGLTSVTIPDSVTSIGTFAFEGTSSMTSCTLPPNNASFTTISESCFKNSGLNSITIPNSVTLIVVSAFQETSSMTSCILPINPSFTTIPNWTFYYSGLTSIAIPNSVTSIGTSVFEGTSSMTSCTFTANSSLETIGDYGFYNSGLTSIAIPNSVTSIGTSVFEGNSSMTSCTFTANSSLETIGTSCFKNLGLTSIAIPDSVTSIGTSVFEGTSSMTSCTFTENSSLETIGTSCFKNSGLTSINIPDSVTTLNSSAFKDCTSLTGFTLPNNPNFTTIPENCFNNSLNWTSIQSIPQSVTSISTGAFTCDNNLANTAYLKIPSTYHAFIILYYRSEATARFATDKGLFLVYNHFDNYNFTNISNTLVNSSNAVFQYDDSGTSDNQIDFDEYKIHGSSLQYFRKGIVIDSSYNDYSNGNGYNTYPYAVVGRIGYKINDIDIGLRIAPYYTIYNNNRSNVKLLPGWKRLGLLVIGGGGGGGSGGVWDNTGAYMGGGSGGGSGGIGLGMLNRSDFSDLNEINIVTGNSGNGGDSHSSGSKANGRKGGYGYHTYITKADNNNTLLIKATGGGGGNGGHGQSDSGHWGWHGDGVKGHHWTDSSNYTSTAQNAWRWQGGHAGTVIYGTNVTPPTNGVGVSDHGEWADGTEGGPNPIRDADNGYGRFYGCQGGKITKYVNIFSSGSTSGNGGNGGNEGPNAGSPGSYGIAVVIQYFS